MAFQFTYGALIQTLLADVEAAKDRLLAAKAKSDKYSESKVYVKEAMDILETVTPKLYDLIHKYNACGHDRHLEKDGKCSACTEGLS